MFIQKIFHVHHNLVETKAQLAQVSRHRRHMEGVNKLVVTADGVAQLECQISRHLKIHLVAVELPTEEEGQILFRTSAGNVEIAGLVELTEVRPELTEVCLTLEYRPRSWWVHAWEKCFAPVERYLEQQLRVLQGCLDGQLTHSPQALSFARIMSHLPQLAR